MKCTVKEMGLHKLMMKKIREECKKLNEYPEIVKNIMEIIEAAEVSII
jgi:hypothetical protein